MTRLYIFSCILVTENLTSEMFLIKLDSRWFSHLFCFFSFSCRLTCFYPWMDVLRWVVDLTDWAREIERAQQLRHRWNLHCLYVRLWTGRGPRRGQPSVRDECHGLFHPLPSHIPVSMVLIYSVYSGPGLCNGFQIATFHCVKLRVEE